MPLRHLTPYIAALPHVRASNALRLVEAVGVGTGSLRPGARDAIAGRWRRAIARPAQRPRTPGELAAMAKAAGIGFRRVTVPRTVARADVAGAATP